MKGIIKRNKLFVIWGLASIVLMFVVHFLFSLKTENDWLVAKWSAGEILTYIGTVSLALLAVWQNKRIQEENDKTQEKLKKIIEEGNNISIINKIVEYESQNLKRLRESFQDFAQSADPQLIISLFAKNAVDLLHIKAAMADAENRLASATDQLGRELRIDYTIKTDDDSPLKEAILNYFNESKKLILYFSDGGLDGHENQIDICKKSRDAFSAEREKYLIGQEDKMNKLLYSNLTLDEIRDMFSRI